MATLREINSWTARRAGAEFLRCCGSSAWAAFMLLHRPFRTRRRLFAAAARGWSILKPGDWEEAFSRHPRIGGKDALRRKFAATGAWARGEQSRVATASEKTIEALAAGNRRYEKRFGRTFIVCATGKSADEMLAILNKRLGNTKEREPAAAAAEQAKITRIRLEKLLT